MASKRSRFDAGSGRQAHRYAVTLHFRDVSANVLQARSHSELDLLVPLAYRMTRVLLASEIEDDDSFAEAIGQIDEDASFEEHAQQQVTRVDQDPTKIARRERLWAKFEELQKLAVRTGLWGAKERPPDPKSKDLFGGDGEEVVTYD